MILVMWVVYDRSPGCRRCWSAEFEQRMCDQRGENSVER